MSPEKLFEKFVKSAEIFKSDKSGQQKMKKTCTD